MTITVFAQNKEVDSLKILLKNHTLYDDTTKINALNNLAFDYAAIDPAQGLTYANQSIVLCLKLKNNQKLGTAYNYKALNYASLGKDTLAIRWYGQAIKLAKANFNKPGEAKALNNLAILYTNMAEYKKALDLRLNALNIFEGLKDKKSLGAIYNNIGVTYLYMANYPQALIFYFKALEMAQFAGDQQGQARYLMNIGLVYKKLGNYGNTFRYYQRALQLYQMLGDKTQTATILENMGAAYDEKGQHQKALTLYTQALSINRKIKFKRGEADDLTDIGIVYSNLKQYSPAFNYLKQALVLYKQSPDDNAMAVAYNELADILVNSPDSALVNFGVPLKNRYNSAEKYALDVVKISRESGAAEREMNGWQTLSIIHEKQNRYPAALNDYKKYTTLKDSIFNDEKKIAIKRAEIQFEADKKEALAAADIQKEKIIKNAIAAGSAIVFVAALALFISYKRRRDALQSQNDLLYRAKVTETEMKILRLQLNPHFIFNSLNSISNYITKNDIQKADYFLAKFSALMRGMLENSEEREISLTEELRMTELYMQLEAARLNNKFTYEIKVDPGIDPDATMIPPLLLQPFVENSIWHGFAEKEGAGHIEIDVALENMLLRFSVTDDGVGRKHKAQTGKKSFGVKITADRLALLNGAHYTNAGVSLTDLEKGTRVELSLPYQTEF